MEAFIVGASVVLGLEVIVRVGYRPFLASLLLIRF